MPRLRFLASYRASVLFRKAAVAAHPVAHWLLEANGPDVGGLTLTLDESREGGGELRRHALVPRVVQQIDSDWIRLCLCRPAQVARPRATVPKRKPTIPPKIHITASSQPF